MNTEKETYTLFYKGYHHIQEKMHNSTHIIPTPLSKVHQKVHSIPMATVDMLSTETVCSERIQRAKPIPLVLAYKTIPASSQANLSGYHQPG